MCKKGDIAGSLLSTLIISNASWKSITDFKSKMYQSVKIFMCMESIWSWEGKNEVFTFNFIFFKCEKDIT